MAKATLSGDSKPKRRHARVLKPEHADVFWMPIKSIRPSSKNKEIYRPIDTTDPEVKKLAKSIKKRGLKHAIGISQDNVIFDGHRRHAACLLLGMESVPCYREPIHSVRDADEFLELLTDCNLQRKKTFAEEVREEVVRSNPEDTYRALQKHRKLKANEHEERQEGQTIEIIGKKHRWNFSKAKEEFVEKARLAVYSEKEYWPRTARRIHYKLLDDPPLKNTSPAFRDTSRYENDENSYNSLTDLLTRMRLQGVIPHRSICDETRPVTIWKVHPSVGPFVNKELEDFLWHYSRDLMQSQPLHIEVVCEKDTLASLLEPVVWEFRIPLVIGRGYCSLPPRKDQADRFRKSGKETLCILFLSDHDPEGDDIPHSYARSMRDDFGIEKISPSKVCLTAKQVRRLGLHPKMKAKTGSSRHDGFVEKHGNDVFELDAVKPQAIQRMLRDAILSRLDIDMYNREVETEKQESLNLHAIRQSVLKVMGDQLKD